MLRFAKLAHHPRKLYRETVPEEKGQVLLCHLEIDRWMIARPDPNFPVPPICVTGMAI